MLSQDIKARCSLVLKELFKRCAGDINKIKSKLPSAVRATVKCYSGDCSECERYSFVCGGGANSSWWTRSMFLASHRITSLQMDERDCLIIQEIVKMKLSESALEELKTGTSTQKCEAINRSFSVSLPKNVNYSRNVYGRVASTVHRLNNPVGESVIKKMEHVGVALSPRTKRGLYSIQRQATYQKQYAKHQLTVKRRLLNKGRHLHEYLRTKTEKTKSVEYRKGLLDPVPDLTKGDHSYST